MEDGMKHIYSMNQLMKEFGTPCKHPIGRKKFRFKNWIKAMVLSHSKRSNRV